MLVMCNNVLNLLCNVSVFIDDEDDDLCFVNLLFCQVSI